MHVIDPFNPMVKLGVGVLIVCLMLLCSIGLHYLGIK